MVFYKEYDTVLLIRRIRSTDDEMPWQGQLIICNMAQISEVEDSFVVEIIVAKKYTLIVKKSQIHFSFMQYRAGSYAFSFLL